MVSLDPSTHPTPNFYESLPTPIYIGEGSQQRVFYAHGLLLPTTSEYFRATLHSNFIKGQQKKCHVSEDDPRAFHSFIQYLYKEAWDLRLTQPSTSKDDIWHEWHILRAQCFVLANKLLAPSVKNLSLTVMPVI